MTVRLNPYLSFSDDARAAMEFYASVFGGELTLMTFGEQGAAGTPDADKIMHGALTIPGGMVIMGADTPSGMPYQAGSAISVALNGDLADGAQLREWFGRLAEGGTVQVPLEKQMWGDEFGMCVDRFGVPWMVDIGQQ